MKYIRILIAFLISNVLTQCQSPSNQIRDAFKTVDNSLTKSNNLLNDSLANLYSTIDSARQKNLLLALKADSIFAATRVALNYIENIKHLMTIKDSIGTNTDLATDIIINSKIGDTLKINLLAVSQYSHSAIIAQTKKSRIDSALNSIERIKTDNNWESTYFKMQPTAAAVTMLSNFQSECSEATIIALNDIKEHLSE